MTALAIIIRYWRELGIGALFLIIAGLALLDAHHASQRDELRAWQADVRGAASRAADVRDSKGKPALLALDQVALQITYLGQGVERLTAALEEKNRESEARAKVYEDSKAENAKTVAELDARYKATAGRVEALRAMAKEVPANPSCRAPAALIAQLEGL